MRIDLGLEAGVQASQLIAHAYRTQNCSGAPPSATSVPAVGAVGVAAFAGAAQTAVWRSRRQLQSALARRRRGLAASSPSWPGALPHSLSAVRNLPLSHQKIPKWVPEGAGQLVNSRGAGGLGRKGERRA